MGPKRSTKQHPDIIPAKRSRRANTASGFTAINEGESPVTFPPSDDFPSKSITGSKSQDNDHIPAHIPLLAGHLGLGSDDLNGPLAELSSANSGHPKRTRSRAYKQQIRQEDTEAEVGPLDSHAAVGLQESILFTNRPRKVLATRKRSGLEDSFESFKIKKSGISEANRSSNPTVKVWSLTDESVPAKDGVLLPLFSKPLGSQDHRDGRADTTTPKTDNDQDGVNRCRTPASAWLAEAVGDADPATLGCEEQSPTDGEAWHKGWQENVPFSGQLGAQSMMLDNLNFVSNEDIEGSYFEEAMLSVDDTDQLDGGHLEQLDKWKRLAFDAQALDEQEKPTILDAVNDWQSEPLETHMWLANTRACEKTPSDYGSDILIANSEELEVEEQLGDDDLMDMEDDHLAEGADEYWASHERYSTQAPPTLRASDPPLVRSSARGNSVDESSILDDIDDADLAMLESTITHGEERHEALTTPDAVLITKGNTPQKAAEDDSESGAVIYIASPTSPHGIKFKPITRPRFPLPTRDRSHVLGLSGDIVLRTCFRVGEALNTGCDAARRGRNVIIELYARVISSSRDETGSKQVFAFRDLFHDRPPFLDGTYEGWKNINPWDYDGAVFLDTKKGEERLCRCMGKMIRMKTRWTLTVLNIWEAGYEDIEHVKAIVCS